MKITELNYNSYNDFLDDLKPNQKLNKLQNNYIFRGQAKDWPLIPSALRPQNRANLLNIGFINDKNEDLINTEQSEFTYRFAEYSYLINFYKNANINGLKFPKNPFTSYEYSTPDLINITDFLNVVCYNEWLPDTLEDIAALAQHYEVPTRLLDWSFDINVALYFASYKAMEIIVENQNLTPLDDCIVVWALAYSNLEKIKKSRPELSPPIKFVIPEYSCNPNLCAQKGILSYWKTFTNSNDSESYYSTKALDYLLKNFECNLPEYLNEPVMYKIKLPVKESAKILKHISYTGYNASKIFPGYYGASKKINEDIMIKQTLFIINNEKNLTNKAKNVSFNFSDDMQELLELYSQISERNQGKLIGYAQRLVDEQKEKELEKKRA